MGRQSPVVGTALVYGSEVLATVAPGWAAEYVFASVELVFG